MPEKTRKYFKIGTEKIKIRTGIVSNEGEEQRTIITDTKAANRDIREQIITMYLFSPSHSNVSIITTW